MDKATADSRSVQSFALNCRHNWRIKSGGLLYWHFYAYNNNRSQILIKKYDLSNVKIFQKNTELISSRDDPKTFIFLLIIEKNQVFLIFNSLKQKKFNFLTFLLTVTEKKLPDSRKRAKILADNRKSHHPIETLIKSDRVVTW